MWSSTLLKNRKVSDLELMKPHYCVKAIFNLSNQALGACLNPYNALWKLKIWLGLVESIKPFDCWI